MLWGKNLRVSKEILWNDFSINSYLLSEYTKLESLIAAYKS